MAATERKHEVMCLHSAPLPKTTESINKEYNHNATQSAITLLFCLQLHLDPISVLEKFN